MKKHILIICAVVSSLGLMAFGCATFNGPTNDAVDFKFNIQARDGETVTLQNLLKADDATDIVLAPANWAPHPVKSMKVTIYKNHEEFSEVGDGFTFTEAQKKLLAQLEYSDSFNLRAQCDGTNPTCHKDGPYEMYKPFTVTPEKEAYYPGGMESIIDFLRKECTDEIAESKADVLDPGFIVFTVSTDGTVSASEHLISCGYPNLDDKLVELMKNLPKTWTPAENANGEKVSQELALRFGDLSGC